MTEFMLAGRPCVLRPDFDALCAIEKELGTGFLALAKKLSQGALTLGELTVVLRHCLGLPQEETQALQTALLQDGVGSSMKAVANMFTQIIQGKGAAEVETPSIAREELQTLSKQFPDRKN